MTVGELWILERHHLGGTIQILRATSQKHVCLGRIHRVLQEWIRQAMIAASLLTVDTLQIPMACIFIHRGSLLSFHISLVSHIFVYTANFR